MFEEIPTLLPLHFFSVSFDIKHKKKNLSALYELPETDGYLDEEKFAKVYCGWDIEGLYFIFDILSDMEKDKIEIFLDTRNLKNHYITKFCHHFLIIPSILNVSEITKFRNDDVHPLAKKDDFIIGLKKKKESYLIDLFIKKRCLFGYDPDRFDQLGFTYKISRANRKPQHFSVSSEECNIEKNPYFWSTAILKK